MATARFLVSGRVQGVFFRASTQTEAERLGIAGSARNLADGRVEVIAQGSDAALEVLETWLYKGPPSARVEGVAREDIAHAQIVGFHTA